MYKICYFKELSALNYSCKQIMQGTWLKNSKKHWCVCVFILNHIILSSRFNNSILSHNLMSYKYGPELFLCLNFSSSIQRLRILRQEPPMCLHCQKWFTSRTGRITWGDSSLKMRKTFLSKVYNALGFQ